MDVPKPTGPDVGGANRLQSRFPFHHTQRPLSSLFSRADLREFDAHCLGWISLPLLWSWLFTNWERVSGNSTKYLPGNSFLRSSDCHTPRSPPRNSVCFRVPDE